MDQDLPQTLAVRNPSSGPVLTADNTPRIVCELTNTLGRDALARRLVAAYNATRGIPVEQLEVPQSTSATGTLGALAAARSTLHWYAHEADGNTHADPDTDDLETIAGLGIAALNITDLLAAVDAELEAEDDNGAARERLAAAAARVKGAAL